MLIVYMFIFLKKLAPLQQVLFLNASNKGMRMLRAGLI